MPGRPSLRQFQLRTKLYSSWKTSSNLQLASHGQCQETRSTGQKMAEDGSTWRKRLTTMVAEGGGEGCSTAMAGNGHFVVYTADGLRFEVPLAYHGRTILGELLRMSQEEFAFDCDDGRITLPCDAAVMEYVMCLLRRNASAEVEKAILSSMVMSCHYASCAAPTMALGVSRRVVVCSS